MGRVGREQVPLHLETRVLGWHAVFLGVSVRLFSSAEEQARAQMALCQGKVHRGVWASPSVRGSLFICRPGAGRPARRRFSFPDDPFFWREGK